MLRINLPNNNIAEREYIVETLFSDFLGVEYSIVPSDSIEHYSILINNDATLIINDGFFNNYPSSHSYLHVDALPNDIVYTKNEFTPESDIPVIYGSNEFRASDKKIFCGIDIFGSAFFMLTRWEEYVNKTRDEHMRFPGKESIAFKYKFLDRPIVNEYVELLWAMLERLGIDSKRRKRTFNLVLTHDIDQLDYPKTYYILLGDLLKRRSMKLAINNLGSYLKNGSNPYDTFNFLMHVSEEIGVVSHFYFMSSDIGKPPDNDFYLKSKRFKDKIHEIKSRGHKIGFHPGYYSYDDMDRWFYEKQLLEEAAQVEITEGRQHFLRFDINITPRIWESNQMEIDSTLGYAKIEGYRCGTGDLFRIYDFLDRVPLQLKERPLIIMDGTLKRYPKDTAAQKIREYLSTAERYNSSITLLFHNTTFYGEAWGGYNLLYENALGL